MRGAGDAGTAEGQGGVQAPTRPVSPHAAPSSLQEGPDLDRPGSERAQLDSESPDEES